MLIEVLMHILLVVIFNLFVFHLHLDVVSPLLLNTSLLLFHSHLDVVSPLLLNTSLLLFHLHLDVVSPLLLNTSLLLSSSSSHMRVMNHNWLEDWLATKQRPHPQSVAEISRHSVLSGDRIRQCETSSGSRHKDTDQCL